MNDYISRSELPPVDRATPRAPSPVQSIQPVNASASATTFTQSGDAAAKADATAVKATVEEDLATAAEYAEVHARISGILADLKTGTGTLDVADAAQSLMPVPFVLVPLPPASREAVEHAAIVAKRMVQQASYAHSAHAQIQRSSVDQILTATL